MVYLKAESLPDPLPGGLVTGGGGRGALRGRGPKTLALIHTCGCCPAREGTVHGQEGHRLNRRTQTTADAPQRVVPRLREGAAPRRPC